MIRIAAVATVVIALAGLFFASYATLDFAEHLDRQVHGIHCSFLPGVQEATAESSDCQVTLMSRYSSVLRTQVWGGIPISLPGMALFGFLASWGIWLVWTGGYHRRALARFTLLAWTVPALTSAFMGYLAWVELDAACKLCIGIYASSFLGLAAAAWMALRAEVPATSLRPVQLAPPIAFVFLLLPIGGYVAAMPSYAAYEAGCGPLPAPEDRYGVFVPLNAPAAGGAAGREAVEVLDPLCPSCRGLEGRLAASGLDAELQRSALLFPLDDACNWMVTSAMHPGACAVSEAMLCEPEQARAILDWAFEHQSAIMQAERATAGAAARMVTELFPAVRGCVGSARARTRLHRGLRWAVANQLPVLTPQLFVDGQKVCAEDTDLGLEYTLTRMLQSPPRGERVASPNTEPAP